ncbi:MAG TPA: hypothetical protein VFZ06_13105 [Acidimicrobiia bacterium]|nr:hypothetical protein [Acidimicrobiia bacterium]
MDPFTTGFNRALRGLRTGDRNSLLSGAALLALALWQRNRKRKPARELLVRKALKPGDTIVIRGARANARSVDRPV